MSVLVCPRVRYIIHLLRDRRVEYMYLPLLICRPSYSPCGPCVRPCPLKPGSPWHDSFTPGMPSGECRTPLRPIVSTWEIGPRGVYNHDVQMRICPKWSRRFFLASVKRLYRHLRGGRRDPLETVVHTVLRGLAGQYMPRISSLLTAFKRAGITLISGDQPLRLSSRTMSTMSMDGGFIPSQKITLSLFVYSLLYVIWIPLLLMNRKHQTIWITSLETGFISAQTAAAQQIWSRLQNHCIEHVDLVQIKFQNSHGWDQTNWSTVNTQKGTWISLPVAVAWCRGAAVHEATAIVATDMWSLMQL